MDTQEQTTVKAIIVKSDSGEWVLDVRGIPFGGPYDGKDAHGEYFSRETEFNLDQYPTPPVVYYHGFNPDGTPATEPVFIGKTISHEIKSDGVWYRVVLDKTKALAKRVWDAAQKGLAYASTGTAEHMQRLGKKGHIELWSPIELSLLDLGEGRKPVNMYAVAIPATKAIYEQAGITLPDILHDQPQSIEATEETAAERDQRQNTKTIKGQIRMDIEQLIALLMEKFPAMFQEALSELEGGAEMMAEDEELDLDEAAKAVVEAAKAIITKDTGVQQAQVSQDEGAIEKAVKAVWSNYEDDLFQQYAEKAVAAAAKKKAKTKAAVTRAMTLKALDDPPDDPRGGATLDLENPSPVKARISVSESLKYAHVSGAEMAMTVKLMKALRPEYEHPRLKLNDLASEDFIRHMAHKVYADIGELHSQPASDQLAQLDRVNVKAMLPVKANELDATNIATQGAEWVTVYYDTQLWERVRNETELFNLLSAKGMRVKDIPQGSSTMNVKLNTGSSTVYTGTQQTNVDAAGNPAANVPITPFTTSDIDVPIGEHVSAPAFTDNLDEDSLIPIASFLNNDLMETFAEALEDALINGDTTTTANTNINLIDGTPSTANDKPLYLVWDGLRHAFLVDDTDRGEDKGGATLSATDYRDVIGLFDTEFVNRRDKMLFIVDESTEAATSKLPEFLTDDVRNAGGTVNIGTLGPVFRVDFYMSGFLGLSNGDGKISATSSNNTKGTIICAYAPYWTYGRKRAIRIEPDRHALARSTVFVASMRHAFRRRGSNAAAGLYDIGF
jgi:hypothetical protein